MSNKNKVILFRVSDKEKEKIQIKADESGKNISNYIRDLILLSDDKKISEVFDLKKKIQELTIYIHRSANNINQIRQIKNSKIYDDDIKNKLENLVDETEDIYKLFLDYMNEFYIKK